MDTGASTHVTNDLNTLAQYTDYDGPDELLQADYSGLAIIYCGSTKLSTNKNPLSLKMSCMFPNLEET